MRRENECFGLWVRGQERVLRRLSKMLRAKEAEEAWPH